jgi:predicted nucleic acid-binding protein
LTYLIETTTFSLLMRRNTQVRAHITALQPADRAVICPITRGEILYGLERLPQGKRLRGLEAEATHWFAQFPCVPVPEAAGDHYARIKREAEIKGTPLDENDLWLAAMAAASGAILVTSDTDFQKVTGLSLEDWTQ